MSQKRWNHGYRVSSVLGGRMGTTVDPRGSRRAVIVPIAPAFPAAAQPSKTMITERPASDTARSRS